MVAYPAAPEGFAGVLVGDPLQISFPAAMAPRSVRLVRGKDEAHEISPNVAEGVSRFELGSVILEWLSRRVAGNFDPDEGALQRAPLPPAGAPGTERVGKNAEELNSLSAEVREGWKLTPFLPAALAAAWIEAVPANRFAFGRVGEQNESPRISRGAPSPGLDAPRAR